MAAAAAEVTSHFAQRRKMAAAATIPFFILFVAALAAAAVLFLVFKLADRASLSLASCEGAPAHQSRSRFGVPKVKPFLLGSAPAFQVQFRQLIWPNIEANKGRRVERKERANERASRRSQFQPHDDVFPIKVVALLRVIKPLR